MVLLFFVFFVVCGTAVFSYIGHQYGGDDVASYAGFIGCIISTCVFYFLVSLRDFIFCPFPARKKCRLRTCHPHYCNWIPIQDDLWYRDCYVCHQEYVLFCFKYETAVNEDGTLRPYHKRTRWGWRKDDGIDSKEMLATITPEIIDQMRIKFKKMQEELNDH